MNILAIETATEVCGAAFVQDGLVRAEEFIEAPQVHSQKIMGLIDRVLASADLEMDRIDGIAVSIGPGSFTGLRIGLSTAKGLAYGLDRPIVPVPTLKALARHVNGSMNHGENSLLLPMIDARRDEVFAAAYRIHDNRLVEELAPAALTVEHVARMVESEAFVIPTGNGAGKFFRYVKEHGDDIQRFVDLPDHIKRCSPAAVGLLGEHELQRGTTADVASLEPLYVKEFYTTMTPLPIEQR
ncbi:MAG TPA: tRNA (adenosine(37)-N6)-threonylcarbamoyltransferase complex dimerization subunit type 1 TsaB [Bacteroidota bacterium]|nr:tRNA (adenosine(37)-N6)-threonylcarbamoyltransferase complex dimerization subunit type 1 TsaB [Bacteroidota bacterium]